jgi:hypothetical protein
LVPFVVEFKFLFEVAGLTDVSGFSTSLLLAPAGVAPPFVIAFSSALNLFPSEFPVALSSGFEQEVIYSNEASSRSLFIKNVLLFVMFILWAISAIVLP